MSKINLALGAAALAAVAYVSHGIGQSGVEFAPPQTIPVPVPVLAPPSLKAEPAIGEPLDAPATPASPAPAPPRPVVAVAAAEAPRPARSPAVYAMAARRQCASIDGDPDAFVLRIVEDETTISTAQLDRIRVLAEQCSRITSETPMAELARLGREFAIP
jgi:hypothetical protein